MLASRGSGSVVSSLVVLAAPVVMAAVIAATLCAAAPVAQAQASRPAVPLASPASPAASPARGGSAAGRILTALRGENDRVDSAVLVGIAGQLYTLSANSDAPDHKSARAERSWRRRVTGGVAVALRGAIRGPGGAIVASGERTPLFLWRSGRWAGFVLPNRGNTVVAGPGSQTAIAVGHHVYLLDRRGASGSKPMKSSWRRVTRSRRAVTALWASSAGVIYLGDSSGALRRYRRGQWQAIRIKSRIKGRIKGLAPDDRIVAIAGSGTAPATGTNAKRELVALSSSGKLIAITGTRARLVATPAGFEGFVAQAIGAAPDGSIVAAGVLAPAATPSATTRPMPIAMTAPVTGKPEVGRIRSGKMTAEAALPLPMHDSVAAVLADSKGGLLLAMSSGRVWVLSKGTWRMDRVSDKLPPSATRRFTNRGPALAN